MKISKGFIVLSMVFSFSTGALAAKDKSIQGTKHERDDEEELVQGAQKRADIHDDGEAELMVVETAEEEAAGAPKFPLTPAEREGLSQRIQRERKEKFNEEGNLSRFSSLPAEVLERLNWDEDCFNRLACVSKAFDSLVNDQLRPGLKQNRFKAAQRFDEITDPRVKRQELVLLIPLLRVEAALNGPEEEKVIKRIFVQNLFFDNSHFNRVVMMSLVDNFPNEKGLIDPLIDKMEFTELLYIVRNARTIPAVRSRVLVQVVNKFYDFASQEDNIRGLGPWWWFRSDQTLFRGLGVFFDQDSLQNVKKRMEGLDPSDYLKAFFALAFMDQDSKEGQEARDLAFSFVISPNVNSRCKSVFLEAHSDRYLTDQQVCESFVLATDDTDKDLSKFSSDFIAKHDPLSFLKMHKFSRKSIRNVGKFAACEGSRISDNHLIQLVDLFEREFYRLKETIRNANNIDDYDDEEYDEHLEILIEYSNAIVKIANAHSGIVPPIKLTKIRDNLDEFLASDKWFAKLKKADRLIRTYASNEEGSELSKLCKAIDAIEVRDEDYKLRLKRAQEYNFDDEFEREAVLSLMKPYVSSKIEAQKFFERAVAPELDEVKVELMMYPRSIALDVMVLALPNNSELISSICSELGEKNIYGGAIVLQTPIEEIISNSNTTHATLEFLLIGLINGIEKIEKRDDLRRNWDVALESLVLKLFQAKPHVATVKETSRILKIVKTTKHAPTQAVLRRALESLHR